MGFRKTLSHLLCAKPPHPSKQTSKPLNPTTVQLIDSASSQYFHRYGSTPDSRLTLPSGVIVPPNFSYDRPMTMYEVSGLQATNNWQTHPPTDFEIDSITEYTNSLRSESPQTLSEPPSCKNLRSLSAPLLGARSNSLVDLSRMKYEKTRSGEVRRGIRILGAGGTRRLSGLRILGEKRLERIDEREV